MQNLTNDIKIEILSNLHIKKAFLFIKSCKYFNDSLYFLFIKNINYKNHMAYKIQFWWLNISIRKNKSQNYLICKGKKRVIDYNTGLNISNWYFYYERPKNLNYLKICKNFNNKIIQKKSNCCFCLKNSKRIFPFIRNPSEEEIYLTVHPITIKRLSSINTIYHNLLQKDLYIQKKSVIFLN